MGAIPEFAPLGRNHLLRSSSVVTKVSYEAKSIRYRTFDANATGVLRLNGAPKRVAAGGRDLQCVKVLQREGFTVRKLPAGGVAVKVRHTGSQGVKVFYGQ